MTRLIRNISLEGDRIIWGVVFALSMLSILVVYSAAGWTYFFSHITKLIIGLACMYMVHKWKFKYFSRIGLLGFWVSILLLVLVFIFGVSVNGASRWLSFAGQQFQPSDIAKLSILLFMARQLSKYRNELNSMKNLVWYIVAPLVFICILILPNNFSTASLVFCNGMVLMYIARVRIKYLLTIICAAIFSAFIIYIGAKYTPVFEKIIPRSTTWVSRIDNFLTAGNSQILDKDYQVTQALVAIHNGGLMGVGPGKSTQRNILPYSYSDFIFAIMVEEYGIIIGAVIPLLLYLILLYRAIRISIRTDSVFGGLVAVGLIFSLVIQALINMLVSVDIMPVTGQTLPLISMGGTSILFTCLTIGIVLSISRDSSDRDYETY